MKKFIVLIVLMFSVMSLFATVQYKITLIDMGMNGWEGGSVDVIVNGSVVLDDITIESGPAPVDFFFDVQGGDQITTTYIPGNNPSENFYYIYDSEDNAVGSDGVTGVPTGISTPIIVVEPSANGTNFNLQTMLKGNFPNPVNLSNAEIRCGTNIKFSLRKDSDISLDIYNILGQKVITLFKGNMQSGHRNLFWNGKDETGKLVSGGIYFYRLKTDRYQAIKKMIIVK
jgi:hypothetical protein